MHLLPNDNTGDAGLVLNCLPTVVNETCQQVLGQRPLRPSIEDTAAKKENHGLTDLRLIRNDSGDIAVLTKCHSFLVREPSKNRT